MRRKEGADTTLLSNITSTFTSLYVLVCVRVCVPVSFRIAELKLEILGFGIWDLRILNSILT